MIQVRDSEMSQNPGSNLRLHSLFGRNGGFVEDFSMKDG